MTTFSIGTEKRQLWPKRAPFYALLCGVLWITWILEKKNRGGRVGSLKVFPRREKVMGDTFSQKVTSADNECGNLKMWVVFFSTGQWEGGTLDGMNGYVKTEQ